jgi:nucleotidyltransferase substrate binding protein (TIGR01987 family)
MANRDVRWVQRFNHFLKASSQLKEAVDLSRQRPLSNLEEQGLIQAFEFTHELAWNSLKDFLESRGARNLFGSRDVTREAFKSGLLESGEVWMEMVNSRNLTSHTYNEAVASQIATAIIETYFSEFESFRAKLDKLRLEEV